MKMPQRQKTAATNRKKKTALSKVGDKFKSIDEFGQEFKMKIDGENDLLTSYMGACLSILFIALSAMFFYSKVVVL